MRIVKDLGKRIRECARLAGSGDELARRTGIPRRTIENYLTDKSEPKVSRLVTIAEAAGVTINWLAFGEGSMYPKGSQDTHAGFGGGRIPVYGLAECGVKGWYSGNCELAARVQCPLDLVDPEAFAVIAVGDSMNPAGISQGFMCFCSPNDSVDPGDAVYLRTIHALSAIKIFLKRDDEWIVLKGWFSPRPGQSQRPFIEKVRLADLEVLAPVIYVKRKF